MADGWVSNTSQEDPPDSTGPAPLELLDSTTPLTPDGHPVPLAQLQRESPAARRVNKNCCALQGKEDKSRKDVGVFVPARIVSFHCSDLRLELLLQKSTPPRSGGEATEPVENPTASRTRSSFHGRVFEEFHFPQGWVSQALAQVSACHLSSG